MFQATLCRLCICSCNEFKSLYDDNEQLNGVYDIAVKYFDASLLNPFKEAAPKVICNDCWQNIYDFHKFQQLVINTQSQLEYKQPIVLLDKLNEDRLSIEKLTRQYCTQHPATPLSDNSLIQINDNPAITQETTISVFDLIQINDEPPDYPTNIYRSNMRLRKGNDAFIAKWMGEIECVLCKTLFPTYTLLAKHFNQEHCDKDCYIVCCGRKLNMRWQIVKHLRQMHIGGAKRSSYLCKLCNASFAEDCQLRKHVLEKHKRNNRCRKYKCEMCSGSFTLERYLRDHYRQKHKDYTLPIFVCNYCKMMFKTGTALDKHQNKEHVEHLKKQNEDFIKNQTEYNKNQGKKTNTDVGEAKDNYDNCTQTPQCDFNTKDESILLSTSEAKKKYYDDFIKKWKGDLQCPICKLKLEKYTLLVSHFQSEHPQQKPYTICCNLRHTRRVDFCAHLRLHINPYAYQCDICEKCLKTNWSLISHKRHVHFNEVRNNIKRKYPSIITGSDKRQILENDALISKSIGDLECVSCSKTFPTYTLLSLHFRLKHQGKQCHIICCGRKFVMRWRVVKHIREMHIGEIMNSYECQSCGASFLQDFQLKEHILNMHKSIKKRENKCEMCTATFTKECYLRVHYRRSHKEYPLSQYICNDCNLMFKTKTGLNKHKKKEHCKQLNKSNNDLEKHKKNEEYINDISNDLEKTTKKNEEYTNDISDEIFKSFIPSTDDEDSKENETTNYITNTALNTSQPEDTNLDVHEKDDQISLNSDNELEEAAQSEFTTNASTINNKYSEDDGLEAAQSQLFNNASPINNKYSEDELFLPTLYTIESKTKRIDEFIKKWKGPLQCPICKVVIEKYSLVNSHFKSEHSQEQPYTICCNLKQMNRNALCAHLRLHINPNAYQCEICKKRFKTMWNLNSHKRHVHFHVLRSKKSDASSDINRRDKRRMLENDVLISKSIGDLKCVLCSKTFATYSLLADHFKIKHPSKKCHIICCGHKFFMRWRIVKHIRNMHVGNNIKLFECQYCGATFLQDCKLRRHIRIMHNKIDKLEYKCDLCSATFARESYVRSHYRRCHKGYPLPKYICNDCHKIFKTKTCLDKHNQKRHFKKSSKQNNAMEHAKEIEENTRDDDDFKSLIALTDDENSGEEETTSHSYIAEEQKTNLNIVEMDDQISFSTDNDLEASQSHLTTNTSSGKKDSQEFLLFNIVDNIEAKKMLHDEFIKKWMGDLHCPICNEIIEKYSLLKSHFKCKHSPEPPYTICCNLKCISRTALCAHLQLHRNPNAYQCDICEKRFKTLWNLKSHKRHVHFNEPRSNQSDQTVGGGATKRKILKNDDFIAKSIGNLKCDLCSEILSTFRMLTMHFKVKHRGEKCYIICCGRKLNVRTRIVQHINEMHKGMVENENKTNKKLLCPDNSGQSRQSKRSKKQAVGVRDENSEISANITKETDVSHAIETESHISIPTPVLIEQIQLPNLEIVDIKDEILDFLDIDSDAEQEFLPLDVIENKTNMSDEFSL